MGKRESAHMSPVEVAKGGALRGNPVYDNIRSVHKLHFHKPAYTQ